MSQRRALAGYFAVVIVAALVVGWNQHRNNSRFDLHDQRSCIQRNRLAVNQRVVLNTLDYMLGLELTEKDEHDLVERIRIMKLQGDIRIRAQGVYSGPENC